MNLESKPYSTSCDQNREPILAIIQKLLADKKHVLEIGSGTGQHAVYFAKHMPHLIWQCSDQLAYHEGIKQWLEEAALKNTRPPLALNVSTDHWPDLDIDTVFAANAVHIMSWQNVKDFIKNAGRLLPSQGMLILYGPFNYKHQYTSDSNAQFDDWLKQRDPDSGIRNFEDMLELTQQAGFKIAGDYEMPANNRILSWVKQ